MYSISHADRSLVNLLSLNYPDTGYQAPTSKFDEYRSVINVMTILAKSFGDFLDVEKLETKGVSYLKTLKDPELRKWATRYLHMTNFKKWHRGLVIKFNDYIKWVEKECNCVANPNSSQVLEAYLGEVVRKDLRMIRREFSTRRKTSD